jgi:hypothetical protein
MLFKDPRELCQSMPTKFQAAVGISITNNYKATRRVRDVRCVWEAAQIILNY